MAGLLSPKPQMQNLRDHGLVFGVFLRFVIQSLSGTIVTNFRVLCARLFYYFYRILLIVLRVHDQDHFLLEINTRSLADILSSISIKQTLPISWHLRWDRFILDLLHGDCTHGRLFQLLSLGFVFDHLCQLLFHDTSSASGSDKPGHI